MKLTIENISDNQTVVSLDFNNQRYCEIWEQNENTYKIISQDIVEQMTNDKIDTFENGIFDFLENLNANIEEFIKLAKKEIK